MYIRNIGKYVNNWDLVDVFASSLGRYVDDDTILNTIENWDQLREYLNDKFDIALSDLEEIDEL